MEGSVSIIMMHSEWYDIIRAGRLVALYDTLRHVRSCIMITRQARNAMRTVKTYRRFSFKPKASIVLKSPLLKLPSPAQIDSDSASARVLV